MARPRVIKIDDGEVILKNLSREKADEISVLLNAKKSEEVLEKDETEVQTDLETPYLALGFHKNNEGQFCIVKIAYGNDLAHISELKVVGKDKALAYYDFKAMVGKDLF